jgi:deoxyribose-phosphate aldolase
MQTLREIISLANEYQHELPSPVPTFRAPQGKEISSWIDHTLLKPEATAEQVRSLCQEAARYGFASVFTNPSFTPLVAGLLRDTPVVVGTAVGFPLGATLPTVKAFEAMTCVNSGATEIDMVINVGALKGEAYGMVLNDIQMVAQVSHNQRAILKVILETGLLTRFEKIMACLIAKAAGADFVKTSTGFGTGGATVEDIDLMYRVVAPQVKVKASGGIRTYADALAMIKAGASRIGTSSGVRIIQEATG